jgi:hypothetical protein
MITGKTINFLIRCHERGYTLDEVRGCVIRMDEREITVDESHPSYPRAVKPGYSPHGPKPGDITRADAPSFLKKVKNFAVASAKHVAAGMPMASDAEILRRHDICQGCEFFKDNSCQKCGCPVSRTKKYISKLSWADQECPVGKWGKETQTAS